MFYVNKRSTQQIPEHKSHKVEMNGTKNIV